MNGQPFARWESPHGRALPELGTRLVWMGILNATPDSFSDGGRWMDPAHAVKQAQKLLEDGADILDIGAESTRPGYEPVSHEEECARLLPVLKAVRAAFPKIAISVDTYKPETAEVAVEAGADIVNDVWGLKGPDGNGFMAEAVARMKCPVIAMHNRAAATQDAGEEFWEGVLKDFETSLAFAKAAKIDPRQIVLDIGIGFGKTKTQQVDCLRRCERLRELEFPLMLAPSRKSVLSVMTGGVEFREEATAAAIVWALARGGCDIARVHDIGFCKKFALLGDFLARV